MSMTAPYETSATISSTEYSLTSNSTVLGAIASAGLYQASIDFSALAAGDEYQVKVYEKIVAGGTQKLFLPAASIVGAQTTLWLSPQLFLANGFEFTVKKIAGTDRAIAWSIRKQDDAADFATVNATLAIIAAYIDTEIGAIKTKTDNLPADTATTLATIAAYIDTEVAAIKSKTDNLPADTAAALTAIPTANQNADALLDRANGVETGWTMRQGLRIVLAALAGKASGLNTTTAKFRDQADSKDRITATVDGFGNRGAVTLDAS